VEAGKMAGIKVLQNFAMFRELGLSRRSGSTGKRPQKKRGAIGAHIVLRGNAVHVLGGFENQPLKIPAVGQDKNCKKFVMHFLKLTNQTFLIRGTSARSEYALPLIAFVWHSPTDYADLRTDSR
jgi:hypothetical protein